MSQNKAQGAGFKPVKQDVNFPELEKEILKFWKKNKIFEKSVTKDAPRGKWTFLDGPPFITGLPHYGNLLSSLPKDLFPRYKTMLGYRVRRVWGWDCHGLPAENKVENKLGIKSKREILEKVGVKKFIDECKMYVKDVSSEWEWYIDHIARWVDFKNAYRTMDLPYMESVMWVFKQMYDKGYIYKGLRVSLYCPHCVTPISNFEVAMDADNYKEITEPSDTNKYKLQGENDTYFLAWSTTPWNKIATPALAVNPNLTYVKVRQGNEKYILAKSTLKILKSKPPYEIIDEFKGKELINKKFEPHYNFYKIDPGKRAFIVIGADFVTADEGTGIVTIAAYGEEDLGAMQRENIQIVMHVDEEGHLKRDVPNWAGMYYLKVNKLVNEDLAKRGLIYREDSHTHSVAHCWRCGTRLFYAPQNAWYVDIQALKPSLKKTNELINWFPEHFKYGRFLKSVESAPDWCISRSRYWGSPVPVWECECGERFVPGSIKELEEASGEKITDLHKPEIDEIIIPCKKCGKITKRVPEVLDSWIEAGSAPFAERHFPFDKESKIEEFFPPDFIIEYTGQIRAWFYVLHVIGTALFNSNAFRNVLVTGVILGTDGRKMSKNFNNYPDPKEMINKYGGDALRLYLLGSPVMRGEDILISEEAYRNAVKGFLLILWNVYNFFVTNAIADEWEPTNIDFKPSNILDRWILSRLNGNIKNITKKLEEFDTVDCIGNVNYENSVQGGKDFYGNAEILIVQDLSSWYIRRIRDRVGPTAVNKKDKNDAYQTLWIILKEYCKTLAPFIPFVTDEMYRNLTGEESVHLANWPQFNEDLYDGGLEIEMYEAMKLSSRINAFRKENNIKVKIPFKKLNYKGLKKLSDEILSIVKAEVNVYKLDYIGKADGYIISGDIDENNLDLSAGRAREIVRMIQKERKRLGTELDERVNVVLKDWPKKFEEEIKKKAMVNNLTKGERFIVIRK